MSKVSLTLITLLLAVAVQARKPAFMAIESICSRQLSVNSERIKVPVASTEMMESGFMTGFGGNQSHVDEKLWAVYSRRFLKRRMLHSGYDVKRETGAYFFDTVYKLKFPTRHISFSLNAGYTWYNTYVHGRSQNGGNNAGLTGGISLMHVNPADANHGCVGRKHKAGFLRFNADLVNNPPTKPSTSDTRKVSFMDKYARDLSARIYIDGKITCRNRWGAFSTYYLVGVGTSPEQVSATVPFFVGVGFGYRCL